MALRRGAPGGQPKQVGGDFYHGEHHQLTVLAAFNDRDFKGDVDATLAQWNLIFNTKNLTEAPFKGSVHDYFYAQSYTLFDLTFDLVYVKVKGDAKKYASDDYDEKSQYLVEDIMEELKTRDIDWSLYDWDGDGFINQLLIVYAGQGMNDYDKEKYKDKAMIWPHQWWMSEHRKDFYKSGGWDGTYCDPIPVTYNDKEYKVDCYCALAELTANNDYGSFGTICHEFTHCFGFPDFYNSNKTFAGPWDLMDYGNYNGDGYCPAGYSSHERWMMGWLTPAELTTNTTITNMPALNDNPVAYLIRNDGYDNEYYMVENRQQVGWDSKMPGSGIIVFHIDYDPALWVSVSDYVNKSTRQHYVPFHANNNPSTATFLSGYWSYPHNTNNQLTDTSEPAATLWNANLDGSMVMSKPLTNMAVSNGLASFDFMGGTAGIEAPISETTATGTLLYRMGNIDFIRDAQGQVRKVATRK